MNNTAAERKAKQDLFLAALGRCASIKQACALAGISRTTVYRWAKSNKAFSAAYDDANKDANDTIDDEIVRRAIAGVEEPLVSMGKLVYEETPQTGKDGLPLYDDKGRPIMQRGAQVMTRKYSDSLLLALARSRMKKYRDRVDLDLLEQINQNTGGVISLNTKSMTAEELAALKQIGQAIKAREESEA